ncbi:hypothetical protein [Streptomyces hyaluromycini]|uniref:hypothetical protein n=1 Tax=Streptomyces hyaluromycini TaxID=1377993 RepID=UPI0012382209|nr:hypothetical protein [Streptomyces hyaluromycini]
MVPRISQELGVVAEEDLDALPSPARTLCGVDAGGQPERDAGVAQVVGTLGQVKGVLVKRKNSLTRSPPGDAVRRGVDVVPLCVAEQAPVACNAEVSYVQPKKAYR